MGLAYVSFLVLNGLRLSSDYLHIPGTYPYTLRVSVFETDRLCGAVMSWRIWALEAHYLELRVAAEARF